MKVELITITPDCEKVIEEAGRTCYDSEVGDPAIIKAWIKAGHESVIEHASATFRITGVSRALMAQLTRHRIASFSIKSQRYVSEDGFDYIMPESIKENQHLFAQYATLMSSIQGLYKQMLISGIKKEDARMVLPNATTTEIVVTMNFRAARNFLKLRLDSHAQWEIRELAEILLSILKEHAPNTFADMENTFFNKEVDKKDLSMSFDVQKAVEDEYGSLYGEGKLR